MGNNRILLTHCPCEISAHERDGSSGLTSIGTQQLRQRDIWGLISGFIVLLIALCLFGGLGWGAASLAAVLGAACLLAYARTVDAERDRAAPLQHTVDPIDRHASIQKAQRDLVLALSQPALIVKDNQITAFNSSAGALFSLNIDTVPPVASLRHPRLLGGISDVRQRGESSACEIVPARHPGQSWSAHITALTDHQAQPDILIVLTDLAPVRRAERARADFLANASHELRTPLTSISGFVETMQGVAKDDKDAWPRFIDIIAEQASHMRGLISDLLSLSRIELGSHEVPDTIIDLRQTLPECLEAMGHLAKRQNVQVSVQWPENTEEAANSMAVIGAESEIKQVVQNLVGNAIKYSPEGGEISVSAGRLDPEQPPFMARSWEGASRAVLVSSPAGDEKDGTIWFSVRDRGVGISPEHLPRLGERFFRVDDSRGGPVEGTGLGLAIVKHIMAHHHGGLAVESRLGEGALFTVWFKAAPPDR